MVKSKQVIGSLGVIGWFFFLSFYSYEFTMDIYGIFFQKKFFVQIIHLSHL